MHGIVFAALRDFLAAHLDQERADHVFAERTPYLLSQTYADEEFLDLFERARSLADEPPDDFLRAFGAFTGATTFARLYPAFYEVAGGTRTFLLTIESRIHELVRATIPNAAPPRLRVEDAGDDAVRIVYDSPRQLCRFLEGLVAGTALYFDETADITEERCMRRGDSACVFLVELSSAGSRPSS